MSTRILVACLYALTIASCAPKTRRPVQPPDEPHGEETDVQYRDLRSEVAPALALLSPPDSPLPPPSAPAQPRPPDNAQPLPPDNAGGNQPATEVR